MLRGVMICNIRCHVAVCSGTQMDVLAIDTCCIVAGKLLLSRLLTHTLQEPRPISVQFDHRCTYINWTHMQPGASQMFLDWSTTHLVQPTNCNRAKRACVCCQHSYQVNPPLGRPSPSSILPTTAAAAPAASACWPCCRCRSSHGSVHVCLPVLPAFPTRRALASGVCHRCS